MHTQPETDLLNLDHTEIAKFSAAASGWWNTEGEFKPLHRINPLRLDYITQRAEGLYAKKVLDVGCGGGILAESMACEGAYVTGLDMAAEPLEVARLHAEENGVPISYLQQTVEAHAREFAGQYDVVTCMEMLEHVPDPRSVVHACARLVRPAGSVFFSTLNRNRKSWLLAIVAAEYLLGMVPRGTHDIKKFIRPAELLGWIDETALCERNITGLHYHPVFDKFYTGPGVDVNYMLHTCCAIT